MKNKNNSIDDKTIQEKLNLSHTREISLKFKGIDDFSRPVFKQVGKNIYFGSTTILFPDKELFPNESIEEINEYFRNNQNKIELFGSKFNCEPNGGNSSKWKFTIID